jgi:hypothetical protein
MSQEKFCYVFGHQCNQNKYNIKHAKYMNAGITWEEARFLIEIRHRFWTLNSNNNNSYAEGYLWNPDMDPTLISKDYIMTSKDHVIVIRKPMPYEFTPYIPPKYRQSEYFNKHHQYVINKSLLSEEDQIVQFVKQETQRFNQQSFSKVHLSDLSSCNSQHALLIPPPNYTCHRCGGKGHWKRLCQAHQIRVPLGIPKTMLREVTNDEEKKHAMLTKEGKYVVKIIKENNVGKI